MTLVIRAALVGTLLLPVAALTNQQRRVAADIQRDVRTFYEQRSHRPAWLDQHHRPSDAAWSVLARLEAADSDGLDAADYHAGSLAGQAGALEGTANDAAAFDVQLTASVLRYMRHLHVGRVSARDLGFHLDHASQPHDFAAILEAALATPSPGRTIADLRPGLRQYRHLKDALPTFRMQDLARARQIELAMERLRWLPDLSGRRVIFVNVPMFSVSALEAGRMDSATDVRMAAIVGRAGSTRTPIFLAELTSVVLNPDWNVPDSIVRGEILPALRRDPNYLDRHHMEIVAQGAIPRIRQLPGPWNALGRIKFVFPNEHGVYLHGTPALNLFARSRRDFSHGCVRVEDPVRLAEWVLSPAGDWSRERILSHIDSGSTRTIPVPNAPVVVLFYMTAAYVASDDAIAFADDIYGHDARLDAWLQARVGDGE